MVYICLHTHTYWCSSANKIPQPWPLEYQNFPTKIGHFTPKTMGVPEHGCAEIFCTVNKWVYANSCSQFYDMFVCVREWVSECECIHIWLQTDCFEMLILVLKPNDIECTYMVKFIWTWIEAHLLFLCLVSLPLSFFKIYFKNLQSNQIKSNVRERVINHFCGGRLMSSIGVYHIEWNMRFTMNGKGKRHWKKKKPKSNRFYSNRSPLPPQSCKFLKYTLNYQITQSCIMQIGFELY